MPNEKSRLIQSEGVGRVCTDHSVDTLQRLAVELADELNNHRLKPVGLNYGLKVRIRVA